MKTFEELAQTYYQLMNKQKFIEAELDYSVFEQHKPYLDQLAKLSNSGITVFDHFKKHHIYTSYNFKTLFDYDLDKVHDNKNEYFDSRVHPEDKLGIFNNSIKAFEFFFGLEKEERTNHKLINEYRVLGKENTYVRIIEQHQTLELDKHGNIWLSLGVLDISPNQQNLNGIKSQMINFKKGELIDIFTDKTQQKLTSREKEILTLVKEGKLSKEISATLDISHHTVNTIRQKILAKFKSNNSQEAIIFADKLGLLN
jgi:DNA-binding CsgD family transcriptional regulator